MATSEDFGGIYFPSIRGWSNVWETMLRMNTDSTSSTPANRTLSSAKAAKQDEFYTQLADIANDLKH
ncbi:MAG: hypothetical protein ABI559_06090 [Chloroflexota bacterium]